MYSSEGKYVDITKEVSKQFTFLVLAMDHYPVGGTSIFKLLQKGSKKPSQLICSFNSSALKLPFLFLFPHEILSHRKRLHHIQVEGPLLSV